MSPQTLGQINFSHDTIQLVSAKLSKLDALIKALLGNRRVPRKTLKQCIGLLIWATSVALRLRSWLAPLYSDLNSPPGSMRSIPPQMWSAFSSPPGSMHSIPPQIWSAFRASLNKDLRLQNPGSFKVAPCAALRTSRECLALASQHGCASRTLTTPTLAFPSQANNVLLGWRHAFGTRLFSPWRGQQLQALAAADACAEDDLVGIGGWAITSSQVIWFAKTWNMQDIRAVWPCLVKPGQRCIACFETLAQLALLQATVNGR